MKFLIAIVANQYQSAFRKHNVKDSQSCPSTINRIISIFHLSAFCQNNDYERPAWFSLENDLQFCRCER